MFDQRLQALLWCLITPLPKTRSQSAPQPQESHHYRHRRAYESKDMWYTRYPSYPPYCSTPEQMAQRSIPVLAKDPRWGETRLQHVTAILRHGARTPYKGNMNCWEDYNTNPETAVWDCNLTAYLSPPPPAVVSKSEGTKKSGGGNGDEAMFLFEKRYDALQAPDRNLSNILHGTCQVGQLLLQGYEQEFANGQFLRNAYVYDESAYNHDARMRLLDISSSRKKQVWEDVYYRVDDEIRTLLSGQVVLRALLGPEMDSYFNKKKQYPVIPLHTADYSRDIIGPNEDVCPRLAEIRERNEASPGFQALNQSVEAETLRRFQEQALKVQHPTSDMLDCLMTTMCTDRLLPAAVNDYNENATSTEWSDEYGTNIFQRLYDWDVKRYFYNIKASDAEYAKLAMFPLWSEIMDKVSPHINGGTISNKLSLISGHDTTIIPLLASLNLRDSHIDDWPTYACMVVLELHEVSIDGTADKKMLPSNYAFRLIYNGRVITSHVEGCPTDSELCDVTIWMNAVLIAAQCERKHEWPLIPYIDTVTRAREILSTTEGILYFIILVGTSAFLGGMTVYSYLNGMSRRSYQTALNNNHDDDSSLYNGSNGGGGGGRRNGNYRDNENDGSERPEINLT